MRSKTRLRNNLATGLALWGLATVGVQAAEPQTRRELLLEQRRARAEQLEPYQASDWERRMVAYQQRPWHAKLLEKGWYGVHGIIGGMPSGSGFVAGVGWVGRGNPLFQPSVAGRISTRGFLQGDLRLDFPSRFARMPLKGFVRAGYQDYTSLRFFGLGRDNSFDDRSFYEYEGRDVGFGARYRARRWLELEGEAGFLNVSIRNGDRTPPIGAKFDPAEVPGLSEQPEFWHYGGMLRLNFKDRGVPPVGAVVELGAERWEDTELQRYDFTRLSGELKLELPLGYRNRRLAFRFRTSHDLPDSGSEVQFYLMQTLGGSQTIRGFTEDRFRDRRNLLLNVEYRWEVWNYADLSLFGDFGKTFADADDFDLDGLQLGYGVGVRVFVPGGGTFRMDVAHSDEGFKFHIGGGPSF